MVRDEYPGSDAHRDCLLSIVVSSNEQQLCEGFIYSRMMVVQLATAYGTHCGELLCRCRRPLNSPISPWDAALDKTQVFSVCVEMYNYSPNGTYIAKLLFIFLEAHSRNTIVYQGECKCRVVCSRTASDPRAFPRF